MVHWEEEESFSGKSVLGKGLFWDSVPLITQAAIPIGATCPVMPQSAKSVSCWGLFPFLVETLHVLMVTQITGAGGFLPYKLESC